MASTILINMKDLDGDGDVDCLCSSSNDQIIRWLEHLEDEQFVNHSIFALPVGRYEID